MYTASKPTRVTQLIAMTGLATLTVAGLAVPAAADEPDTSARTKCVEHEAPYYFHGLPMAGGLPTVGGTFDQTEPESDRVVPSFQHTRPAGWGNFGLAGQDVPFGELSGHWEAGFTGQLCGEIEFTLYASKGLSTDPVKVKQPTGPVAVSVYADRAGSADTFIGWSGPLLEEDIVTSNEKQEVSAEVHDAAPAVTDALIVRISDLTQDHDPSTTFYYDHPDYAANFRISTLQPCEVHDPHPDCVEAGFDDLASDVTAFAETGEVTADGETQLLAALDLAETAYGGGAGDNAEAVARLEEFQQLAADPALVPSEPARDTLTATAGDLIAALEASEPA